jgi:hypothetical protein
MACHTLIASGIAGLGAMCMAAAASATGAYDGNRETARPLVVTAFGGHSHTYQAPLTPWGDPDFQGVWSSDDTSGIPLSRPARFGDRLYLTDSEFADRRKQVNRGVEQGEEKAAGTFRFDFARHAFPQTSLIVDPADGRMPDYAPAALKHPMPRGTFGNGPLDSPEDFSLYERCITRGIVGSVLRVIYGNGNRIVQAPGVIAITYEMVHDTRVIYTDGRPHVGQGIRQYLGDSRGHWEGGDLVVETTNLSDRTAIGLNGGGIRHSTKMRLTERIRRVASDILQYQITVDDPLTYQQPFTISMPLTPLDGGELLPYECHEGNMALLQALGGERAEDRKLAADLARGIRRPRRPVQDGLGVGGQPLGEPLPGTPPESGRIPGGR